MLALLLVTSACGRQGPAPGGASPGPSAAVSSPAPGPSPTPSPTAPPALGGRGTIQGTVTAGPTCPVERVGQPCPPVPVVSRVEARLGGASVASSQTSATGAFSMAVPPGTYTVVVIGSGPFPRCPETPAVVAAGAVTTANVMCDTGIR